MQPIHIINLNFFIIYQQPNLTYDIIFFIFNSITNKVCTGAQSYIHLMTFDRLGQENESNQVTSSLHFLSKFCINLILY